jgi:hypothetical protein
MHFWYVLNDSQKWTLHDKQEFFALFTAVKPAHRIVHDTQWTLNKYLSGWTNKWVSE